MPSTYSTTEKLIANPSMIDDAIAAPASEARLAAIRKAWSVARRAVDGKAKPDEIIEAVRDAGITGAVFKTWTDWLRRRDSILACAKHLPGAEQELAAAMKAQEVANRRADELRAEAAKIAGEAAAVVHDARQLFKTRRDTAAQVVGVPPVVSVLRPDAEVRERAIRHRLHELSDQAHWHTFDQIKSLKLEIDLLRSGKQHVRYTTMSPDEGVEHKISILEKEIASFEKRIADVRTQRAALEHELGELERLAQTLMDG
jgi:chromosome segregation ATPase